MNAVEYTSRLVSFDSTCHKSNAEVSDHVQELLIDLGCQTERVEYDDVHGVRKVCVLGKRGEGTGGLAYFGHTDVVVSDDWSIKEHGPFEPTIKDGRLYGRGSTDMKGSIGCMLAALEATRAETLQRPVYISCSSDEEIDHRGAKEIVARSQFFQELHAGDALSIVGEPTRLDVVYAHKGGVKIVVTSHGKAAHSSTREGLNANLAMIPFLQEAKALHDESEANTEWMDNEFDPPVICLNIGINDFTNAINITPPQSVCTIGFRPMPDTDADSIIARLRQKADEQRLDFALHSHHQAFRRNPDSDFIQQCVRLASGNPPRTVAYGSEASNLPQLSRLIVLGPGDIAQAHKSDEWISLEQLEQGTRVYTDMIRSFCQA